MFHDFVNLLYPTVCHICEAELLKNEKFLCINCLHDLPVTNYHLDNDNPVKKVFYGRVKIENAASLLHFRKKSGVQQLIHDLKYKGHNKISNYLGRWYGTELLQTDWSKSIDLVIPVPLHRSKLKKRGFNQVEGFGREIATMINAEYVDNILIKTNSTQTQTLKDRISRWGQIQETLEVQKIEKASGKHILLVDDLVTTGATLEACSNKLLEIPGVKLSIATMAITN
ncbi:ComF family protein [Gramella lutea]|uniref:ComF family protein n=1 Tax=Christiangramia lutea TaxID=1607951 RepID=A0A9X2A8D3_9FLAO|nr:phosphoribosyltransferase family protein [Christiangramia lutea]MCH4822205.1 ComF family protein [Christiangramia lutea]